jgi:DNA mismatch repair protein MSH3
MTKTSQSSQGGGQKTISSFFTPKASQTAPKPAAPSPPPKQPNLYEAESEDEDLRIVINRSKRALVEDANGGIGNIERPTKRAKGDDAVELVVAKSKSTKPSPRTEHYVYTGSSQISPDTDNALQEREDDDAEEKARKEELHRRWVKKMGTASIGRRWQTEETPVAEGDEDAEEEEAAVPAKNKKKGAKTGKLTPLELQILDIKRKHMDTILIVEVGYKFKFFGEDARTAAKALSIVCIPGKFRYDERRHFHILQQSNADKLDRPFGSPPRSICLCIHTRTSITCPCKEARCCGS